MRRRRARLVRRVVDENAEIAEVSVLVADERVQDDDPAHVLQRKAPAHGEDAAQARRRARAASGVGRIRARNLLGP